MSCSEKTCTALDPNTLTPPLNVTLIQDEAGLLKLVEYFGRVQEFQLDLETNVVPTFYDRRIRTIQIGDKTEQYIIDLLPFAGSTEALISCQGHYFENNTSVGLKRVVDVLTPVLDSDKWLKVGYNLDFEYTTLRWCLGIYTWHLWCCYLAEKVIHCGRYMFKAKGLWGLDDVVQRRFGVQISKDEQKGFKLEGELTESQLVYGALDIRLPAALKIAQTADLVKAKLTEAAQLEFDAIPAFGDMHLNGMLADQDKWLGLVAETKAKKESILADLDKLLIPVVGTKAEPSKDKLLQLEKQWREEKDKAARAVCRKLFMAERKRLSEYNKAVVKCEGEAFINYGSNPQLKAALIQMTGITARKLPNTDDETLAKLAGHPAIDALREFRTVEKVLTTYGEEFLTKYVDNKTGRIHSRIDQLGAETGRTSSSAPNVQNILKGSAWRSCFVARPGKKLLTMDYSGQELRIAAELSQQRSWIDAFNNGWDIHSVVAELLFGERWRVGTEAGCAYYHTGDHQKCKCKAHKDLRDKIKAINFGLCIAGGQRVLTNIGLVPIENVTTDMKVWDGVEWVEHEGVVRRTADYVMTYDGVTATYSHPVYTHKGHKMSLHAASQWVGWKGLAITGNGRMPLPFQKNNEPREDRAKTDTKKRIAVVYDLMNAGPRRRFTVENRLVGNCYGMSPRRLATELNVPLEEAQALFDEYHKINSDVIACLEKSALHAATAFECRTLSGRRRLFNKPTWESVQAKLVKELKRHPTQSEIRKAYTGVFQGIKRQGMNTPIQGSGGDTIKKSVSCKWDADGKPYLWQLCRQYDAKLLNCVHDELILEVDESIAEPVFAQAKDCMVRGGGYFVKSVKMEVEGAIADAWQK